MNTFNRTLFVSLFVAPMLYLAIGTNAQAPQLYSALSRSPVSSGVLMARSIDSGQVRVPGRRAVLFSPESLTMFSGALPTPKRAGLRRRSASKRGPHRYEP
jgi:hypothetical protein